jgi:two-component sensor histidine kinase
MTPAPPSAKRFRRFPVTTLILVLILAVAAPSIVFSAVLLLQSDNVNRRAMEARAAEGVDGIADTLERELSNMATNLSVLAASGWMETGEYERLHARASKALEGTETYFAALNQDFEQVLNTRVPWGKPLETASDIDSARKAVEGGLPTVSNVFFGQAAQDSVFNVTLPIISGEFDIRALVLQRSTNSLRPIFVNSLPPPGWTYAILDGAGQIVAGDAPGPGSLDLLGQLCAADTASLHEIKVGEIQFSAAAQKLDPWGWRACVWTSSDQTEASISQRWRNFTVLTLVIVAITILAGAAMGQMLASAIRRAATVGRALDAGGEVPETRSVVREVDEVLATLTRAARRRLQYDDDQKVLLRETAHRAKNQIAIASALVRLSAGSAQSIQQLRDDIVARLSALGRSIDTMSATPSGNVSLKALATAQLEPFAADHPGRLDLPGGNVWVTPTTAQSLGLVLHEMATNASKYGAWSTPEGRVTLDWTETADGLTIVWSERDGPMSKPPTQAGFGSSLIEMMIERSLGGSVQRDFRDTGLVATFRLPAKPLSV